MRSLSSVAPAAHADRLAALTLELVNIPSVSGSEGMIADAVEARLRQALHLEVLREGDTVVARTHLGRAQRVILAGHLDTVPITQPLTAPDGSFAREANVPGRLEDRGEPVVWGRGAVDMKGGAAVLLDLACSLSDPVYDLTWVFYDHEEVAADLNGLGRVMAAHPEWIEGDFAVLGEPTGANIEGGCNGTLRLILEVPGVAAHSGRAWRGMNAIHAAGTLINRAVTAPTRTVNVEGLEYRESFSVVLIEGGVATNTIPDRCRITVNYRFAPDLTAAQALARAFAILAGEDPDTAVDSADSAAAPATPPIIDAGTGPVTVTVDDLCEAARPGLDVPLAQPLVDLVRARGGQVAPKFGWTDVARFSAAGIPAVNLGPGDPMLCHTDDEHCPVSHLVAVREVLERWLTGHPPVTTA